MKGRLLFVLCSCFGAHLPSTCSCFFWHWWISLSLGFSLCPPAFYLSSGPHWSMNNDEGLASSWAEFKALIMIVEHKTSKKDKSFSHTYWNVKRVKMTQIVYAIYFLKPIWCVKQNKMVKSTFLGAPTPPHWNDLFAAVCKIRLNPNN